ncbi:MAG: XdhC family protein [Armatimonadota bacterium]|nr:XdhC family protein [Armatimonadota bacterium]MDR7452319.1 XdhC family protein [Armatimonadota bacterium]MDR7467790.1 XdhC family protein [Armatimonadota bacterium]MDR7494624.1 XdhC family protein [Armatimonadota bacterium]MDR7499684.1 XdhC family protein [Armatimonadota bacterium]
MRELLDILTAIDTFAGRGERLALATIVGVRGSTYRRAGARLLMSASQEMVGNISGGCLESDLMVVADEVMASGTPRLVTYDLTADDDAVWGLGLGCNGAVELFVEPVDPASAQWPLLRAALQGERTIALVKLLDGPPAGRWIAVRPDGAGEGRLDDPEAETRAVRAAQAALAEGASRLVVLPTAGGDRRAFVEVIRPPIRLIVCGAGHDAIPVVQFASAMGWRVVVVDPRERFLTPERFPGARQFVRASAEEAAGRVAIDDRTYVVVMTHNYLHDRDLLRGFLATPVRYIGMLGPRQRTEKILEELRGQGVILTAEDRARLFGPVGLDIGGEGPEAIALALLAEIQAVEAGRRGGFLRERRGPIHETQRAAGAS